MFIKCNPPDFLPQFSPPPAAWRSQSVEGNRGLWTSWCWDQRWEEGSSAARSWLQTAGWCPWLSHHLRSSEKTSTQMLLILPTQCSVKWHSPPIPVVFYSGFAWILPSLQQIGILLLMGHLPFPMIRPVFMVGTVKVNSCRPPGGPMFQFPCPRPRPLPPPCPGGPPAWTLLSKSEIISAACCAWSGGPMICAILSGVLPSSVGRKEDYYRLLRLLLAGIKLNPCTIVLKLMTVKLWSVQHLCTFSGLR